MADDGFGDAQPVTRGREGPGFDHGREEGRRLRFRSSATRLSYRIRHSVRLLRIIDRWQIGIVVGKEIAMPEAIRSFGTVAYLFDPLCGWCYGASPMLGHLRVAGISIELIPTGLFSGAGARPMDKGFAAYAWSKRPADRAADGATLLRNL